MFSKQSGYARELPKTRRTPKRHNIYGDEDAGRLAFIRHARGI
jgi:DNA-binding transcriptional MerR regulator